MQDAEIYNVIIEVLRLLFLSGVPLIAAVAIAGTLTAALQSSTAINEPALGYAVRVAVSVLMLYFIWPATWSALVSLSYMVYG